MLIVNDPSLNGGRKLRPNVKNRITANTNNPHVTMILPLVCAMTKFKPLT